MASNGGYPTGAYRPNFARGGAGFQGPRLLVFTYDSSKIPDMPKPPAQNVSEIPRSNPNHVSRTAKMGVSKRIGKRLLSRFIPGIGWVLLAVDVAYIGYKLKQHFTNSHHLPEAFGQDGYNYPSDSWTYCSQGGGEIGTEFPVSPAGYQECGYVAQKAISTTGPQHWILDFGPPVTGDPTPGPGEFIWKANEWDIDTSFPPNSTLVHHQRVVRSTIPDNLEEGVMVPMPRFPQVPDWISPDVRKPGETVRPEHPPWRDVPERRPNPDRPPNQQPETGPRPVPKPRERPLERPAIEVGPDGKVRHKRPPHILRPPRKNEKEIKKRGLIKPGSLLAIALGTATEGSDLIYAIYDALPDKAKLGEKAGWRHKVIRRPPPQEAARRIYDNLEDLDVSAAAENYLTNWIEDQLIGRANQAVGGFAGRSFGGGITIGPAI